VESQCTAAFFACGSFFLTSSISGRMQKQMIARILSVSRQAGARLRLHQVVHATQSLRLASGWLIPAMGAGRAGPNNLAAVLPADWNVGSPLCLKLATKAMLAKRIANLSRLPVPIVGRLRNGFNG
jgi:hypothetical protein